MRDRRHPQSDPLSCSTRSVSEERSGLVGAVNYSSSARPGYISWSHAWSATLTRSSPGADVLDLAISYKPDPDKLRIDRYITDYVTLGGSCAACQWAPASHLLMFLPGAVSCTAPTSTLRELNLILASSSSRSGLWRLHRYCAGARRLLGAGRINSATGRASAPPANVLAGDRDRSDRCHVLWLPAPIPVRSSL